MVISMSYTASKVTENFTSYTFSEKGIYVFTGSIDGGFDATLGGTCTQLYYKHSSKGTVAVLWAEAEQTLTNNKQYYSLLVKVSGYNSAPKIKYSAEGTGTVSVSGKKDNVYIGMAVGHWHGDTLLSYSFTCTGTQTTIAHSNAGWSGNAMSLMIPSSDSTVSVTTSGASGKYQGYLVQLSSDNTFIKVNGSWKEGTTYIKVNGQWKQGEVKVKHTTWKGA